MLAFIFKWIKWLVMPTFVFGGFFSQNKDLYPPYIKKEKLTQLFLILSAGAKSCYITKL